MKRLLAIAAFVAGLIAPALLFVSLQALANPFLIADVPTASADTCVYTDTVGLQTTSSVVVDATLGVPANGNRICKVDVATAPVGANNVKLRLRSSTSSPLWGDSVDVPFSFVRPQVVAPPTTPRLTP